MSVGVLGIFKIGIRPSRSHTAGLLRAPRLFVVRLERDLLLDRTVRATCDLYGSPGDTAPKPFDAGGQVLCSRTSYSVGAACSMAATGRE